MTTPLTPPSLHNLTSIQEYNLQQLASLAEKTDMEAVTGSSNTSPTPPFSIADLFNGDFTSSNAIHNLQALAKLTLNNQGEFPYQEGKHFKSLNQNTSLLLIFILQVGRIT